MFDVHARVMVLVLVLSLTVLSPAWHASGDDCAGGLLPDMQTVVPQHLNLVNPQGREVLRFSNGVANTGDGPWRMRAERPTADPSAPQLAVQEVLDAHGAIACEAVVSAFEFHPAHNHFHIDGVAEFEVRVGAPDGPTLRSADGAAAAVKTTFCLIDWIRLEGNTNTGVKGERVYFDCAADYQGISPGWVDQYHHATDGQEVDITGAPAGLYYLVSTANAETIFLETDTANNAAWQGFLLSRHSNGNPKITLTSHSPCSGGLCGAPPNR